MTSQDADSFDKICKFFCIRVCRIVVESRQGKKQKTRCGITDREWFNLSLEPADEVEKEVKRMIGSRYPPRIHNISVDILLQTADGDILPMEIWSLSFESTECDSSVSVNTDVYHRFSVLIRSVLTSSRATPCYKYYSDRQSRDSFVFLYSIQNSAPHLEQLGRGVRNINLGHVRSPFGTLKVELHYRTHMIMGDNESSTGPRSLRDSNTIAHTNDKQMCQHSVPQPRVRRDIDSTDLKLQDISIKENYYASDGSISTSVVQDKPQFDVQDDVKSIYMESSMLFHGGSEQGGGPDGDSGNGMLIARARRPSAASLNAESPSSPQLPSVFSTSPVAGAPCIIGSSGEAGFQQGGGRALLRTPPPQASSVGYRHGNNPGSLSSSRQRPSSGRLASGHTSGSTSSGGSSSQTGSSISKSIERSGCYGNSGTGEGKTPSRNDSGVGLFKMDTSLEGSPRHSGVLAGGELGAVKRGSEPTPLLRTAGFELGGDVGKYALNYDSESRSLDQAADHKTSNLAAGSSALDFPFACLLINASHSAPNVSRPILIPQNVPVSPFGSPARYGLLGTPGDSGQRMHQSMIEPGQFSAGGAEGGGNLYRKHVSKLSSGKKRRHKKHFAGQNSMAKQAFDVDSSGDDDSWPHPSSVPSNLNHHLLKFGTLKGAVSQFNTGLGDHPSQWGAASLTDSSSSTSDSSDESFVKLGVEVRPAFGGKNDIGALVRDCKTAPPQLTSFSFPVDSAEQNLQLIPGRIAEYKQQQTSFDAFIQSLDAYDEDEDC